MQAIADSKDREDWLAARRKYITASDAAAILGHSPWATPLSVWAEKTEQGEQIEETERMRLGRYLEPGILARYALDSPYLVEHNTRLYAHPKIAFLAATPDALVFASGNEGPMFPPPIGLAQAKTTSHREGWDEAGPPLHYQIQGAIEMAVLDVPWDDFPTVIAGSDYICPRVERHEAAEKAILEQLHEFWHGHVLTGTPPPPTGDDRQLWAKIRPAKATTYVFLSGAALDVFASMRAAEAEAKLAEQRAKDLKAQLLTLQGDAELGVIDGTGMAMKRTAVAVPEKLVKAYSFERYSPVRWKE